MQALNEEAMSAVHGSDGLQLELGSNVALEMARSRWITDSGTVGPEAADPCAGGTTNRHACTLLTGMTMAGAGVPLYIGATVDVGAASQAGGPVGVALNVDWQPNVLVFGGFTLDTPTVDYSGRSLGTIAVRSDGFLNLFNQDGLFNSSGNTARLHYLSQGDIFIRQGGPGSPELSLSNFVFENRFTTGAAGGHANGAGKIAVDGGGLLVSAPFVRTDFAFDLAFKASPTNFDTADRNSIVLFGWRGGLVNPMFSVAPGGVAYGTYPTSANTLSGVSRNFYDHTGTQGGGARTEGLHIDATWDFDTDFALLLGQAGGNRTQVRFSNWRKFGGWAGPMLSMPVTLDVTQNNTGPAGLCFGGGFTAGAPVQTSCTAEGGSWIASRVATGKAAIAGMIRDGYLHAYNQTVEVYDPNSALPYSDYDYDWSLLYTFGKLDADVYLYPEGRGQGVVLTTTNTGLKADITLTAQSPGYWDRANSSSAAVRATAGANWAANTHFMVADTAVGGNPATQFGVGLVNADLLWRVRDLYFRIVAGDSGYPTMPGGLWMQTDTLAQYRFRGLFGGGNLAALGAPTSVALMDVNLQTSRFIFALHPMSPIAGDAPIGFSGLLDLQGDGGSDGVGDGFSYFSFAEVSSPASAFRIYDASGRIGWANGRVNLVSGQNNAPTNLPKLTISNDLLFGQSAGFGGAGGAAFIGKVGFGQEYFGRAVLPAGQWNSEITLKIPNT